MDEIKLSFTAKLPKRSEFSKSAVLIYDKVLDKKFSKWISSFKFSYGVKSGEELKTVESFSKHMLQISKLIGQEPLKDIQVVALGGGSIGDFAGFVASVFKRGVGFVQIPSTWLGAVDSAHGGKTALNVGKVKNQIGTFYPAQAVYLVQELLFSQPKLRADEAFGEFFKIALLEGGELWEQFSQTQNLSHQSLWQNLGKAIEAKYRVVAQDPYEETGYRHLLNLGHTFGHALEVVHGLPHGIAVNAGIRFSLLWSLERKYLSPESYTKITQSLAGQWLLEIESYLSSKHFKNYEQLMLQDKKRVGEKQVRFIFMSEIGSPLIESVKVSEILKFINKLSAKVS